jgi:hypothetical protein
MSVQQLELTVSLLLGSAIVGFLIGLRFRLFAIVIVSLILVLTATILLREFRFGLAVVITIAVLWVNQIAYFIAASLRTDSMKHDDGISADG